MDEIERAEVAGPGFLNVFLAARATAEPGSRGSSREGDRFGTDVEGRGQRAMVEFVSANPTGPLTLGHGRQGILGDCVARLFQAMGYDTTREYYFNNAGRQMRVLGESVRARYLELLGQPATFPEDGYQGDYIREIAAELRARHGESLAGEGHEGVFRQAAEDGIFADIRRTLERLGIRFDVYSNEALLYTEGKVDGTLEALRAAGFVYDKDGAVWLRFSAIGRPQDRVLVKSTGEPTYRLPDIAYHREKLARGFDRILNVQGADHIEEAKDVVAAIGALGLPADRIRYLIHQFVTITRGGVEVKMSTRRATYVTIDDLLDQVGNADVFRWFMVTRSPESHLNFDLDAATEQDWQKNPVFYVQYAHARVASVFNHARERGSRRADRVDRGGPGAARGAGGAGAREGAAALPAHGGGGRPRLRAAPDRRVPLRPGGAAPRVPPPRHPRAGVPDRPSRGAAADARPAGARPGGRPGSPERARAPGNLRAGVDVRPAA